MTPSDPLAFLLTFTCYGTWLHGDQRGSIDKEHNRFGEELLPEDAEKEKAEFSRLKHKPVFLSVEQRDVVKNSISEVCQYRRWHLNELNVMTNHVHLVVQAATDPEKMISDFKSYSTRHLREKQLVSAETKVWTRGGSRRYLWDENSVINACRYVREQ